MSVRATVKGWNVPSVAEMGTGDGRSIRQGVVPTVHDPQWFRLEVANADDPRGEDYFEFSVHTPDTLHHLLETRGAVLGRGIIVVIHEYDPEMVKEVLRPLVESVVANSWEELAFTVGSLGPWEFEGWRWHPEEERLRPERGIQALVREVRLGRTALSEVFSLPGQVRFGATGVSEEVTVPMMLESPAWIQGQSPRGAVIVGSGRIFALEPDPEAIRDALNADGGASVQAPSWNLLRLTLQGLGSPVEE